MIISLNFYYFLCVLIVILALLPMLYGKIRKKGDKFGWTWIFVLLLIPINWYTPAVYDVQDCGVYTKDILILPKGDYKLGRHNYVINNSEHDLYFESIVYGNVSSDKVKEDFVIKAGTSSVLPVIHVDYLFETAPTSVKIKGDGTVHVRLSCDQPVKEDTIE